MKQIIMIAGKDRVGKTTTANKIVDLYPGWKRFSFAYELRNELIDIYELTREDLENKSKTIKMCEIRNNKEALRLFLKFNIVESPYYFHMFECDVRTLYNIHGTRIRRAESFDYWVHKCINGILQYEGNAVIDDARFANEFEATSKCGDVRKFYLYNDDTMGLKNPRSLAEEYLLQHVSENREQFEFLNVTIPVEKCLNDVVKTIMKEPV